MNNNASVEIEEFRVDVPADVIDDLTARLAHTRWPDQIEGSGWDYGTNRDYLQELCAYWQTEFDWTAAQTKINQWPQIQTTIDGERIHAIHARSPHPEAIPLLLSHGWPGSIVEFLDVIGPLVDPPAYGGDPRDAFHVVAPSLPGYAWSGPTSQTGWHIERVAAALDALMVALGYDRYGAQGGDWGALATSRLGVLAAPRLIGIHLNLPLATPPTDRDMTGVTDAEAAALAAYSTFQKTETGYSAIQGSKPQTVAYALNDSPAGLAGWMVEKFRSWSDCGGDVESVFRRDDLLTNITAYWVTGTAGSSARLYYETMRAAMFGAPKEFVKVPTGVAIFPKELLRMPRVWIERSFNLTHFTVHEHGGHFAAMEQPTVFVADVRDFFRTLRTT
jgi:pimeloyl-ACP methyl ester carboxylesterase